MWDSVNAAAVRDVEDVLPMNEEKIKVMSRELWEEAFPEDTQQFLDYYDKYMADHNRIYMDEEEGEAISMIHCNPYCFHIGRTQAEVSYLVAVSTKEEYRHQGRMRRLMQKVLLDSYRREEPFVYLSPVAESIYQPFDFRTVFRQNILTLGNVFMLKQERMDPQGSALLCRPAEYAQLAELADFSEQVLERTCSVYAKHDLAYFQRIWEEQKAMNGRILLFYQDNNLVGYCLSGLENVTLVWELVINPPTPQLYAQALRAVTEYFKERLPVKICGMLPGVQIAGIDVWEFSYRIMTMVRITNLSAMAKVLCAKNPVDIILNIKDDLIEQNNGCFRFTVTEQGGHLERLEKEALPAADSVDFTIGELTDIIFGVKRKAGFPSEDLHLLQPLYLNEIV